MERRYTQKTVRHADEKDIRDIVSLHQKTIKYMRSLCPPGFGKPMGTALKRKEVISQFSAALSDDNSILLVCEADGRFSGFALGTIERFQDDLMEAPFLTVVYIETEPQFRRQGVARTLLARLGSIAKRRNLKAVELTVWIGNLSAVKLYESLGFQHLELRMAKPLN